MTVQIIPFTDISKWKRRGWRVLGFAKRYGVGDVAVWVVKDE